MSANAQIKRHTFDFLKSASEPSRLFNIPTASVLQSTEFLFSSGSAFGVEGGRALLRKFTVGLGGIAEVEMSTSGVTNRLTGESETMPTSSFKVCLIPERFREISYLPDISVQLRSTSWKPLSGERENIRPEYTMADARGENLISIQNLEKRYSVLFLGVGKRWTFGGIQLGVSQTDVRTKEGIRYHTVYVDSYYRVDFDTIPAMRKSFIAPFGGIEIAANNHTRLIAEIQAIPIFDYSLMQRTIEISQAWLGVAGVRFFIAKWFSLDTGVKYQSDYHGIADAEINIGINIVIPIRQAL
jgi:hypothetical protein